MSISLIASTKTSGSATGGTTGSIDTSGANLIVLAVGSMSGGSPSISDSKGNSYTPLASADTDDLGRVRLYYCVSPTVGSGHTFTVSGTGIYASLAAAAFSGVNTADAFEAESTNFSNTAGTSGTPGSITPAADGALIVFSGPAGSANSGLETTSVGTVAQTCSGVLNETYSGGIGYHVQTTAAAINPTLGWGVSTKWAAVIAAFNAASGGDTTAPVLTSPTGNATGTSTATVGATTDEGNGTMYAVVTTSATQPSVSQIKAGQNHTGAAAAWAGSISVTSTGAKTLNATGLSPGTAYYAHLVHTDAASNDSNRVSSSSFTTTALTLSSATVAASGGSIALTFSVSASLTPGQITVKVNGYQMRVSAVSGSGSSWTATLDRKWVRAGATVVVRYGGADTTATNNSTVTDAQVRYVGRRFGMFVHFNMETFLDQDWGDGDESANLFAPTASVADGIDQWIAAAIAAGMQYVVLTATHMAGFCLWPSTAQSYNVSASSWYSGAGSPDIVRLFTSKVRAAGLGVGLYFCVRNRNWELANPGFTGAAYTAFNQALLSELLSNYGPIDSLWMDAWGWDTGSSDDVDFATVSFASLYDHIKGLQPRCQVVVNTHEGDLTHTDIVEFENGSFGEMVPSGNLLVAEACDTIRVDNYWFWKTAADAGLSAATILSDMATCNSRRATYLLNCPPATDALLPAATVATLADVGASQFEEVRGISKAAGTAATRTVSLTLTTDGSTPAASLTGLKWAFWDQPTPSAGIPPVAQGTGATTNGSGVLTVSAVTSLPVGGVGWITVTNSDGTTTQSPAHKAFSGPVTVS